MMCYFAQATIVMVWAASAANAAQGYWPKGHWYDEDRGKNWPEPPQVITPEGPKATDWWRWVDGERTTPLATSTTSGPITVATTPTKSAPSSLGTSTSGASSTNSSAPATKTCTESNACCSVKSIQASFTSATASATATVPAALAYECINSVPYNQSAAVAYLDSIRPFLDWQTTVQWIQEPPPEYAEKIQPPYDFWAEFERVYSKAKKQSGYSNEYEFGFDLYRVFQKTHDGHFAVFPDSVDGIFAFGRTTPLVSVSVDGSCIPEVFVYQDLLNTVISNATYTPSPVAMIDGRNSTDFLLEWSQYGSLQDRDALWNNVFYLLGQVSLGAYGAGCGTFAGGGRGRKIYPGPRTTLTFANGSEITNENFARVLVPFDNITSGADIYTEYFTPPDGEPESAEQVVRKYIKTSTSSTSSATSTSTSTSSTTSSTSTTTPAPGYPTPLVRQVENLNSGYLLDDEGYDDIAVLSVQSFVGLGEDGIAFQAVNSYVINEAVKRNKTKLIIDLSANGGGTILQGIDLFKQLFPFLEPYQADRYTAHEANDYIGQEISHFAGLIPNRSLDLNTTARGLVGSFFNYRSDVDINHENFTSWADKFGPVALGPQQKNFTQITRWNLSDPLTPQTAGGIVVSGYLNHTNFTRTPFKAENVVMVTDGYCASTCTIFSELMRQQAGIRTIVLGGRPNADIAQAVGGVKGTNSNPYSFIFDLAQQPFIYEYVHNGSFYNKTALGKYNDLALYRSTKAVVNARDGFRQNDSSGIPLHFMYEPADCRIYYTPEMAVDQVAVWKTVADSAFRGINHCIAGSLDSKAAGYIGQRGDKGGEKHMARRDLRAEEHEYALGNVWTGKGGLKQGGDARMVI